MDLGLTGKCALVTAASQGIGKAIAKGLAAEGARVAICARREDVLRSAAEEIGEDTGATVYAFPADVSDPAQVKCLVEQSAESLGGLHVLVCNAGGPPPGVFLTMPEEHWEYALRLNLLSTVNLCRHSVPHMIEAGWGRILTVTSTSAKQPIDGLVLSNMARPGVVGFVKSISDELAPHNITVNNVCPGSTLTARLTSFFVAQAAKREVSPEEVQREQEQEIPMRRCGTPEEVADVAVFLASDRASYVTGVSIQVDGGSIKGIF